MATACAGKKLIDACIPCSTSRRARYLARRHCIPSVCRLDLRRMALPSSRPPSMLVLRRCMLNAAPNETSGRFPEATSRKALHGKNSLFCLVSSLQNARNKIEPATLVIYRKRRTCYVPQGWMLKPRPHGARQSRFPTRRLHLPSIGPMSIAGHGS